MPFLSSRWAFLAAVGVFIVFTAATVLLRPILPIDETRYLTVAWEMRRDGTWLVPQLNGALYSHKPPPLFWLVNLAWSVTGVTETAARLVAPGFELATLGLTWLLARRLWPGEPARAGLAAVMLATGAAFLIYASATMFDMMLTAAVLLAMLALLALRHGGGAWAVLALGAALALGVSMPRGPVVLVHVAPAALLMPLWADGNSRPSLTRWLRDLGLALVVALLLVGLWLGPALALGGPEYRADDLWRQSAGRVVAAFDHGRPAWAYAALLPAYLWPWGWTRQGLAALAPRHLWADEPTRFVALWAGTAFLALGLISGKQPHYLVPELPAVALLLSGMGLSWQAGRLARVLPLLPTLLVLLFLLAVAAGRVPSVTANGSEVSWAGLAAAMLLAGLLLTGALLLPERWPGLVLAPLTLVMFLLAASPLLFAGYDPNPIARVLTANEGKGVAITDNVYHGQFNFAGRLEGPVTHLTSPEAVEAWAAEHPGGLMVTRNDLSGTGLVPEERRRFNGKDYVLYRVPEATP